MASPKRPESGGAALQPPPRLSGLPTPAFVVNRRTLVSNCRRASTECGVRRLRPHVKTHKTAEGAYVQAYGRPPPPPAAGSSRVGGAVDSAAGAAADETEGYREEGGVEEEEEEETSVVGFVASTVPEVEMLVDAARRYGGRGPFIDVLYGVPISESRLGRIDRLRREMRDVAARAGPDPPSAAAAAAHVHLLVDHADQVDFVERYHRAEGSGLFTAFLKVDTGYGRAGVAPDEEGADLAVRIMRGGGGGGGGLGALELRGIYSHCGHAYDADDPSDLEDIARSDLEAMEGLLGLIRRRLGGGEEADDLVRSLDVSVGSTPSLFHHRSPAGGGGGGAPRLISPDRLDVHPGNYMLYDRQQLWTGAAADESDVACRVLSRVIGRYEDRGCVILDAGATALTKDGAPQGGVCAVSGRPDLDCYRMSQEVTMVRSADPARPFPFGDFPLGAMVTLLPNHSCLAAACFDRYHIIDDPSCRFAPDEVVVDEWVPAKGW